MERQIRQEQVLDAALQSLKNSTYHVWPGSVQAFRPSTWTADVQIAVNDPRTDPETGVPYGEPWPVIPNVPVWTLRGSGFVVACPLKQGDPVLMLAWDVDPTPWLAQGASQPGTTQAVNPHDVDRHSGSYWLAVPLQIFGPPQDGSAAANGLLAGLDGDTAQIRFAPGTIQLGRAATHPVTLADQLATAISSACTAAESAAVHGDGGHAAFTAFASSIAAAASSFSALVVKAQ